ncbi:MAG: hypothetical protein PSU94_17860, partial [Lacunisphaera sp.]|nr:hypothetical protein [Lacunisphaera sp.]
MNKIPVPLTPVPKPVDPTKTTANITVLMKNLGFAEGSSIATIYNGSDPQSPVGSIVTDGRSFTATANTIAKSTLFRRGDSINPTSLADATEKLGLNSGLGGVVVIDHGYFDGANILKEQLNDSFYQTVSAALDPDGARLLLLMGCNVGGHDGAIEMFTSLASKYNINIIVANNDVAFLSGGGEYNSTIQPNGFRWIRVNSDGTIRYFYGNGYESAAPPTAPPDTGTSTPGAPPSVAPPPPSPQSPREPVFPRDRNLEP